MQKKKKTYAEGVKGMKILTNKTLKNSACTKRKAEQAICYYVVKRHSASKCV